MSIRTNIIKRQTCEESKMEASIFDTKDVIVTSSPDENETSMNGNF